MSYESSSGSKSPEQEEPLSATAMFLRSLESPPADAPDAFASGPARPGTEAARSEWPAEAAPPPSPAPKPGPGEFTRIFQAMDKHAIDKVDKAFAPAPADPAAGRIEPATTPAAAPGPGEFTRIFVAGSTPVSPAVAKTVIEPPPLPPPQPPAQFTPPPPAAPPAPPKLKGFSSPGISDSASAEGSFTQIFKPVAPSSSAPAPSGSATGIFSGSMPASGNTPAQPAAPPESKLNPGLDARPDRPWKPEPDFGSSAQPPSATPPSGITGFVSALATPSAPVGARAAEPVPYRPDPVPAYTPQTPTASPVSTLEAGSVTRLINRLSQVEAAPPPPPPVASPAAPPAASGPGEFTRMISAAQFGNAAAAPPPVAPSTPPPAPAGPAFALPQAPPLAIPPMPQHAAPPPPAMHLPHPATPPPAQAHLQPPKIEAPKPPALAAPALAAPKGKLEAMVPILLVVNTFLLIVLLVVVIFAMKR